VTTALFWCKCCKKERARTLEQDAYVTCRSCTSPPTRSVTGSSSCGPRILYNGYACPVGGPALLWSQTGSVRRSGRHAQRSAVDNFMIDLCHSAKPSNGRCSPLHFLRKLLRTQMLPALLTPK